MPSVTPNRLTPPPADRDPVAAAAPKFSTTQGGAGPAAATPRASAPKRRPSVGPGLRATLPPADAAAEAEPGPPRHELGAGAVQVPEALAGAGWEAGGFGGNPQDAKLVGTAIPMIDGQPLTAEPVPIYRMPTHHVSSKAGGKKAAPGPRAKPFLPPLAAAEPADPLEAMDTSEDQENDTQE